MRIPPIAVMLWLMGLIFNTSAQAMTRTQNFEKTYALAAGGELMLRNTNGAVTVEAWDKNEVRVEARKRVTGGNEDVIRKALEETRIEASRTPSGLKIVTRRPTRNDGFFSWLTGKDVGVSVDYRIWVPRSAKLDVVGANGVFKLTGTRGQARLTTTNGAISVDKVKGAMQLATTNGRIQVDDSAGAVRASSTNGKIEVRLEDVPQGSDLSLSTTNGAITVQLPRDIRATVDAATTNGRVSSDFAVNGAAAKSQRRVAGAINGGGGTLRLRTSNGSIHIVEG